MYSGKAPPTTSTEVLSIADSAYAPSGSSPLGKLASVSRPYAPRATKYSAVCVYDGIGRTDSATAPDGASKTTYYYAGAVVTVTDAANNWKTLTTDAVGNLTQVH